MLRGQCTIWKFKDKNVNFNWKTVWIKACSEEVVKLAMKVAAYLRKALLLILHPLPLLHNLYPLSGLKLLGFKLDSENLTPNIL